MFEIVQFLTKWSLDLWNWREFKALERCFSKEQIVSLVWIRFKLFLSVFVLDGCFGLTNECFLYLPDTVCYLKNKYNYMF